MGERGEIALLGSQNLRKSNVVFVITNEVKQSLTFATALQGQKLRKNICNAAYKKRQ